MPAFEPQLMSGGDLGGRKVLFIAYFFPPTFSTGVPGSLRTVKFLRNLTNGECHVLTVPEGVDNRDNALSHLTLPVNGETIHRVAPWDIFKKLLSIRKRLKSMLGRSPAQSAHRASSTPGQNSAFNNTGSRPQDSRGRFQQLKDFIYDLCYFPDQAGPWIFPAARRGKKLVREESIDVIFATGSPWSSLITGYLISKATDRPLIVDFRDPWRNNPFHQSKGRLLDSWSERLEKKVVEHASAVSLNTEPLLEEFLVRYPDQVPDKFFVMPNGFDEADIEGVKPGPRGDTADHLLLCHAGFLYGVRDPEVLLDAIRRVNNGLEESGNSRRIIFRQIGDVQLSYDVRDRYKDLVASGQLRLEAPIPYQKCLSELAAADIVVNVQPGTRTQIPSKLYDYLGLKRPVLHLTPPDGALGRLVQKHQLGTLVDFTEEDRLTQYLHNAVMASPGTWDNHDGYNNAELFSVSSISSSLADTIRTVTQRRHP